MGAKSWFETRAVSENKRALLRLVSVDEFNESELRRAEADRSRRPETAVPF